MIRRAVVVALLVSALLACSSTSQGNAVVDASWDSPACFALGATACPSTYRVVCPDVAAVPPTPCGGNRWLLVDRLAQACFYDDAGNLIGAADAPDGGTTWTCRYVELGFTVPPHFETECLPYLGHSCACCVDAGP